MNGPKDLHDAYRVNKGGQGSFDWVLKAWKTLVEYGVDVNILCSVQAANKDHPLEVYRFFRDELKAQYMQFIPIIERATPENLNRANQGWSELPWATGPFI
jgi:uncharacterized protein